MAAAKRGSRARRKTWVRHVQETSNAMDLPSGIFKGSPQVIAGGLKRSVERRRRTKGRTKFQAAMSMLNLNINRSGRSLSSSDKRRLARAKIELRTVFGRPTSPGRTR